VALAEYVSVALVNRHFLKKIMLHFRANALGENTDNATRSDTYFALSLKPVHT
jgi:hypothetical protein